MLQWKEADEHRYLNNAWKSSAYLFIYMYDYMDVCVYVCDYKCIYSAESSVFPGYIYATCVNPAEDF